MFLDTTVLVEVLRGNAEIVSYVERAAEKESLLFSIVQVGELADWSHHNGLDPSAVLDEVRAMATMVNINERICIEGSKIKQAQRQAGKKKFSLMDGLIAASARSLEQRLLTTDRDFEGLEDVAVL